MNLPLNSTLDPRYVEAAACFGRGQLEAALPPIDALLQELPDDLECLNLRAAIGMKLGRKEEAESLWRRALAVDPCYPAACSNLGLLLQTCGRHDEAEATYRRALAVKPEFDDAWFNLGLLMQETGRPDEALEAFGKALAANPLYAKAAQNMGAIHEQRQQLAEAEAAMVRAEEAWRQKGPGEPSRWRNLNNLGLVRKSQKKMPEAAAAFRQALALNPTYALAANNLGLVLHEQGEWEAAEAAYAQALQFDPVSPDAWNNLGNLHKVLGRLQTAEVAYRKALALRADYFQGMSNLGLFLVDLRRYEEAEVLYRESLRLAPTNGDAVLNYSLLLLLQGRFEEGWPGYEARYDQTRPNGLKLPRLQLPRWQGEDIQGKSLMIFAEQGYGDEIQFVRYLRYLKDKGARRVDFVCKKALLRLWQSSAVADQVVPSATQLNLADYDFWDMLMSVPLHSRAWLDPIPQQQPYLKAAPELVQQWAARIPQGGFKVGLVWKGNLANTKLLFRSLSGLSDLAPLWQTKGVQFISLQKGAGEDEALPPPPGQALTHLGSDIGDFADSAAIISQLDLMITVDSAPAHLAAALGVPCWVFTPFRPDWRWPPEQAESPWYRDLMRHFRQRAVDSPWSEVVDQVAAALKARVTGKKEKLPKAPKPLLDKETADQANARGVKAQQAGQWPEAEAAYAKARRLAPENGQYAFNQGTLLQAMGRYQASEIAFRETARLAPEIPETAYNLGLSLLAQGRYGEGWLAYEGRYDPRRRVPITVLPQLPYALWQGEPLAGKSILVWLEQGFGDEIQFVRYLPRLKAMGAVQVVLLCKPALYELFRASGIADGVMPASGDVQLATYDYWAPLLNLPRWCGTWQVEDIPGATPYLKAPAERLNQWATRLAGPGFKVGLVWKGQSAHGNDARRSLGGLPQLAPLWQVPGAVFYSLQKGAGEDEAQSPPAAQPLVHLGSEIRDFADSAAVIQQLDLVICVDTAIAHLAGALGRPCWVLIPARGTDWRWLQEREDSPWYPQGMRLFRQSREEDWPAVVARLAAALQERLAAPVVEGAAAMADEAYADLEAACQRGEFAAAESAMEAHLRQCPEDLRVLNLAGFAAAAQGRGPAAMAHWEKILQRDPAHPPALRNLATAQQQAGRLDLAIPLWQRYLAQAEDGAAWHGLGLAYFLLEQFPEAEEALRRALALAPDLVPAWYNLGALLAKIGRDEEAVPAFEQALKLSPNRVDALTGLGVSLARVGRMAAAEPALRTALAVTTAPGASVAKGFTAADVRYNLALVLLAQGKYAEGWPAYEARHDPANSAPITVLPPLPYPRWQGEPLQGKSILVWLEQGFGDELQFVRFLPALKARGAQCVTLVCKPPLLRLFAGSGLADRVLPATDSVPLEPQDYWSPLLSLPLGLGTTLDSLPAPIPYLKADPALRQAWQGRLPPGLKVGLVWKGNLNNTRLTFRSLSGLAELAPLWQVPGVSFISLQKGPGQEEALAPPADQPLVAVGAEIEDFADTAALISQLDLLITVDSAPAHLAGALGCPCWVLLPALATDWRWLQEREDSPWYPGSMRLFRQQAGQAWSGVVARIRTALAAFVAQRNAPALVEVDLGSKMRLNQAAQLEGAERVDEAVALLQQLLAEQPGYARAWQKLATLLEQQQRPAEAERAYRQALSLDPAYAVAWNNLGILLQGLGRWEEAIEAYQQAVSHRPDYARACYNLGCLWQERQQAGLAETFLRQAVTLDPGYLRAQLALARLLQGSQREIEAIPLWQAVVAAEPGNVEAWRILGQNLRLAGRLAEAEHAYRQALALRPDLDGPWLALGVVLRDRQRWDEAEQAYRQCLQLSPDDASARMNLGMLLLITGRYAQGWPLFEARYDSRRPDPIPLPSMPFPMWRGEPLQGKSIVIWPEQGFGDKFQFVRYAQVLKAMGASRVTLVCSPALATVFARVEGVDTLLAVEDGQVVPLQPHDYWSLILSLPTWCGTTLENLPSRLPYLQAEEARCQAWRQRLPAGRKVGLVWRGRPTHGNDKNRSLAGLQALAPLWQVPGIHFISLQKGEGEDEAACPPAGQPLLSYTEDLPDFADTAALINELDLVICIDTAVAHLAGALGKPCWVLLPGVGLDWRWLTAGENCPWYPGVVRLFRQEPEEPWATVVQRVAVALASWSQGGGNGDDGGGPPPGKPDQPSVAQANSGLQVAGQLCAQGRYEEALASLAPELDRAEATAESLNLAGICHIMAARPEAAEALWQRACTLDPDSASAWRNLGHARERRRDWPAALQAWTQCQRLSPEDGEICTRLGCLNQRLGRLPEAREWLQRGVALAPDSAFACINLGMVLIDLKDFDQAEALYRRYLAAQDSPEVASRLGMLLLHLGRYREAWPYYGRRCEIRDENVLQAPELPFPRWQGEAVAGRSLLLLPEQGLGDYLQAVRFLPRLKALGVTEISLVCPRNLAPLLGQVPAVDRLLVAADGETCHFPRHDYWAYLFDLPAFLEVETSTLAGDTPYLTADAESQARWAPALAGEGFKLGLVWKGNGNHTNDLFRSVPDLQTLAPLWQVPGLRVFSLQKGQGEDQARHPPEGQSLVHLGDGIEDFGDTAAILAQLDLLISVDTSVVHLAGAMGCPCWVLLPEVGVDWRWGLSGEHTPWYPESLRLFRSEPGQGWAPVIARVAEALQGLVAAPVQQALALWQAGAGRAALAAAQAGLALEPRNEALLNLAGAVLLAEQRAAEALPYLQRALAVVPQHPDVLYNLGLAHHALDQPDAARLAYQQALAAQHPAAAHNLGRMDEAAQDWAAAEKAYRQAIAWRPDYAKAWHSLGLLLEKRRRWGEAEAALVRAVELDPDNPDGRLALALRRLAQGDYPRGWPDYEARYDPRRAEAVPLPSLTFPAWQGQELQGRSLLVWPEQGFGDEIQGLRYLPLLKARGLRHLTLLCKPELLPWLQGAPGADQVLPYIPGQQVPVHDFWVLPMSLPGLLGTAADGIPPPVPLPSSSAEKLAQWSRRLPPEGFRVGLVWRGSPHHGNDALRSIDGLRSLLPLARIPGLILVSLQKGAGEAEAANPPQGMSLLPLGQEMADFSDTAALISLMDLVISVDTAAVHVAGTLGKPCWVLLGQGGVDWRWRDEGAFSPWYPGSVRLFRAGLDEGWESLVERVAQVLRQTLASSQGEHQQSPQYQAAIRAYDEKRFDAAITLCQQALVAYPHALEYLNLAAGAAMARGRYGEAEPLLRRGLALYPGNVPTRANLAVLLHETGRAEEAEIHCRRALALAPEDSGLHSNLGSLLQDGGRYDEAEGEYREAVRLQGGNAMAWSNLGALLRLQQKSGEAEECYRRAWALQPGHPEIAYNLSTLMLAQGRYAEAWPLYESRTAKQRANTFAPPLSCPPWRGESLAGRHVLVWPEQGMGDELQFVRYLPWLRQQGAARVTLACKGPLQSLFAANREALGVDEVVAESGRGSHRGEAYRGVDTWVHLMSLPRYLNCQPVEQGGAVPYLRSDPALRALWRQRLPAQGLRVGLVWRGNPGHQNDALRSLPGLETLAPLAAISGVHLVDLSKAAVAPGGQENPPFPCLPLGREVRDFADLAALLDELDLIISVDTAVAHLAGAMGRPAWVMLPWLGLDWRWQDGKGTSPWYPGLKRYRRRAAEKSWQPLVKRVAAALEKQAKVQKKGKKVTSQTDEIPMAPLPPSPPAPAVDEARLQAHRASKQKSLALYRAGDFMAAVQNQIQLINQPAVSDDERADDFNLLGGIFHALGDHGASVMAMGECARLRPGDAQAQENLAVALKFAGRIDESIAQFEKTLAIRATPNLLDGLASALSNVGRYEEACARGRQSLSLKDAEYCAANPYPPLNLPPRKAFDGTRPERNIIAFSLWGDKPRYIKSAVENVLAARYVYPTWRCRFYCDHSVPEAVRERLREEGAQVVMMADNKLYEGLFWRFQVVSDPEVDFFLVRDADAVVNTRERVAVDEWLASDRHFHVMRDWYTHTELILAGMWGGVAGLLPDLTAMLARYRSAALETRTLDQQFLRAVVWPLIKTSLMSHDSLFGFGDSRNFPAVGQLAPGFHVGQSLIPY